MIHARMAARSEAEDDLGNVRRRAHRDARRCVDHLTQAMAMKFTFLGTGCPVASPMRAGPAHLVTGSRARLLIDCGAGVSQRLVAAGERGADIDALIVTHYHSDHVVDFYQLLVSSWHQGRARPFVVHAPANVISHMRHILEAYADERELRIAHERRPSSLGLEVEFHELAEGRAIRLGDLEAEPFSVDHRPVKPAFGLVLRQGKTRVVFSGDTRPVPALVEAARGAELLVCEVFVDREMMPTQGVRSAETIAAVRSYHLTPRQIAKIARDAGVMALALTHFVPPNADRSALVAEIRKGFRGPVIVGEDLMSIDPALRTLSFANLHLAY
ncbi:MAG: MBL fold metallo-hydrolase [Hyphomicrobiales bacterium]|nr:MBL fold metallo-hydrolase [Hyphomicrobiales bacterium]